MLRLSALVLTLGVAACAAPVGVRNTSVPRDAAPQCASICSEMGLGLDSVVVMADNVGCVCRAAPPSTAPPGAGPSASAGGMAAVMMQQAARSATAGNQSRR